jgi:hypothetical protein
MTGLLQCQSNKCFLTKSHRAYFLQTNRRIAELANLTMSEDVLCFGKKLRKQRDSQMNIRGSIHNTSFSFNL